jgi:hypothetical protein
MYEFSMWNISTRLGRPRRSEFPEYALSVCAATHAPARVLPKSRLWSRIPAFGGAMTGYYVKIDEAELADLVGLAARRGEEGIDGEISVLMADEDRCIDIDKAWHGIHVMLNGNAEFALDTPLGALVLGGTAINDVEMAHLPLRHLDKAMVAAVCVAIARIDLASKADVFASQVLGNPEVYPGLSEAEDLNYLDYYFEQLKGFFAQAASSGSCMLLFIG